MRHRETDSSPLNTAAAVMLVSALWSFLIWNCLIKNNYWINLDVAQELYTGLKVATGQKLYVDWMDTNPPAIYLITAFSAWCAERASVPLVLPFYILLFLFIVSGIVILKRRDYLLGYLLFIFGVSFHGFKEFGQREYWFTLFFIPYVAGVWQGRDRRFVWVFLTSFMSSMKPGFTLMMLVAEFLKWKETRVFDRRRLLSLGLGLFLPYLILAMLSFDSFHGFFTEVVPSWRFYTGYDESFLKLFEVVKLKPFVLVLPLLLFGVTFLFKVEAGKDSANERGFRHIGFPLMLVAIAWALYQHKFWSYHFIPVYGVGVFFTTVQVDFYLRTKAGEKFSNGVRALLFLGCLALLRNAASVIHGPSSQFQTTSVFAPLLSKDKKVMLLTEEVESAASVYFSRLDLVGPWAMLHSLRGILEVPDAEMKLDQSRKFLGEITDRLESTKPELVLVDAGYAIKGISLYPLLEGEFKFSEAVAARGYRRLFGNVTAKCIPETNPLLIFARSDLIPRMELACSSADASH